MILRRPKVSLALILVLFVVLAISYSFVIPVYEAPDEDGHIVKANYMYLHQTILEPNLTAVYLPISPEPPLYHATIAGILYLLGKGPVTLAPTWSPSIERKNVFIHTAAEDNLLSPTVQGFHILRIFSVLLGALTVFVTYKTGLILFNKRRPALLAAAANAFIPQFTFMSAVVHYDMMVALFSSLSMYLVLKMLVSPNSQRKDSTLCSFASAAAMLTKYSGIFTPFVAVGTLFLKRLVLREGDSRKVAVNAATICGIVLLLTGWYYIRNEILYGESVLTWPLVGGPKNGLFSAYFLGGYFYRTVFTSFWFVFGWMNVPAPSFIYQILAVFSVLAVLGVCIGAVVAYRRDKRRFLMLAVSVWTVILVFGGVVYYNLLNSQPQGRFMFPAISLISVLIVEGLQQLSARALRNPLVLPVILVLFLFLTDLYGILVILQSY